MLFVAELVSGDARDAGSRDSVSSPIFGVASSLRGVGAPEYCSLGRGRLWSHNWVSWLTSIDSSRGGALSSVQSTEKATGYEAMTIGQRKQKDTQNVDVKNGA